MPPLATPLPVVRAWSPGWRQTASMDVAETALAGAVSQFGPFDERMWLNTAHQRPLPRPAVEATARAAALKAAPHRIGDDDFRAVPETYSAHPSTRWCRAATSGCTALRHQIRLAAPRAGQPAAPAAGLLADHAGGPRTGPDAPDHHSRRSPPRAAHRRRNRHRQPGGQPAPVSAPVHTTGDIDHALDVLHA